jgi:HPt (histidine-containing phosphotransfer) domain-containing protein
MDDYVSKPTSLDNLRDVLERWLPTPERRQTNRNGSGRGNPAATLRVERLLELFDGDRGAVITLLSAAAGSIKADFARIENCAAAHEFPAAAEAAHRLKGTSTSIRSPLLGDISAAIERAARGAPQRIPEALLAELRAGVEAVIADVEKHSKLLTSIS